LKHEHGLHRTEENEKHMRALKDAVITMKGEMMALPIMIDGPKGGLLEGEDGKDSAPARLAASVHQVRIGEMNNAMAVPKSSDTRDAPLWARRGQRTIGPVKFRNPNFETLYHMQPLENPFDDCHAVEEAPRRDATDD
jgi:hypothetical protein